MAPETRNEAGCSEDFARLSRYVVLKAAGGVIARLPAAVLDWQGRLHQRQELLELPDRVLHDVGINRSEAEREAVKPFWRS